MRSNKAAANLGRRDAGDDELAVPDATLRVAASDDDDDALTSAPDRLPEITVDLVEPSFEAVSVSFGESVSFVKAATTIRLRLLRPLSLKAAESVVESDAVRTLFADQTQAEILEKETKNAAAKRSGTFASFIAGTKGQMPMLAGELRGAHVPQ